MHESIKKKRVQGFKGPRVPVMIMAVKTFRKNTRTLESLNPFTIKPNK